MKIISAALMFALIASLAHAEVHIEVGPGVCDHLVNYVEPPGVEYQPGVDAYGHPVAPADMTPSNIKLPEKFVIPITDQFYGRLAQASGVQATGSLLPEALLGVVTYDHGQLTFNGRPLAEDPDAELARLCQEQANYHE